ncbi:hypothetical protein, partial [Bartonella sp. AA16SXTY]|uniref:hypothetical protein n=1 Tax=Bartonella sp. AA16SXTY TaxID=3243429 RepID=UPI0035CED485
MARCLKILEPWERVIFGTPWFLKVVVLFLAYDQFLLEKLICVPCEQFFASCKDFVWAGYGTKLWGM